MSKVIANQQQVAPAAGRDLAQRYPGRTVEGTERVRARSREAMAAKYSADPQAAREAQRTKRAANPEAYAAAAAKSRAKRKVEGKKRNPIKDRDWQLRTKYGITSADYDALLEAQGGGCAICGTTAPGGRSRVYFHVDHDHVTNVVRGLLCHGCNISLGLLQENVDTMMAMASYIMTSQDILGSLHEEGESHF